MTTRVSKTVGQCLRELEKRDAAKPQKRAKPFALAAKEPKKKHRSAAEWLAIYRDTPPRPIQTAVQAQQQRALFDAHDPVVYRLWLPLAPSNNALKQIRTAWRKHKAWLASTAAAEAYPVAVAEIWQAAWQNNPPPPLACRVRILITVHPPREGSDIFNREKALCDALTSCGVWRDDVQIDAGGVVRGRIIKPAGAMDVTIEAIS